MKDFTGFEDAIKRMAEARFEARDNGIKTSNDTLEACMLLSMIQAYNDWVAEQPAPAPPEQTPAAEPAAPEPADDEEHGPTPHRRGRR